jgi:glycosyltransferase involved in cell wall biosynthesis
VVYWNNIPSPYMVERFNALADRGGLEFEAWFNDRLEPDRSWDVDETSWRFRYRCMPTLRVAGRRLHFPLPLFDRRRPDVLVSLYAEPSFLTGWLIARLRGVKTGFRVLMTHDSWVSRHPVKEAMKRYMFSRVDAVETPGRDGAGYAMRYGTPEKRIFRITHTVDIPHYAGEAEKARTERERIRADLGLRGVTFIYVGRLWWGKGLKYLVDAFAVAQKRSQKEVSLLLVGDGSDEVALRQRCGVLGLRNVVFTGFIQKPEIPRYYAASDVFVFPTLGDPYGLVVDEAMVCSLPVISTIAAGEISARIEEGVNGFIVPPEDSDALADRMLGLARDPGLRERMGKISAEKIAGNTPERWAEQFEQVVYKTLATP